MKEIKLLIWGLLILYVQVLLMSKLELFDVIPNLLIAFTVFVSLKLKMEVATVMIFLIGIAYDLTYPLLLGLNTIALLLISLIVVKLQSNINKERFSVVSIGIFILNLFYYSIFMLYYLFINQFGLSEVYVFLLSAIYNTFISILFIYLLIVFDRIKLHLDV